MSDGMFDEMLLGLAQRHDGIDGVLHTLFSFFERRTDLFHVMESKDAKMGFPKGHAEEMVMRAFRTFQLRYDERTGQDSGVKLALSRERAKASSASAPARSEKNPKRTGEAGATDTSETPSASSSGKAGISAVAPSPPAAQRAPGTVSEALQKASHISTWNGAVVEGKYLWSQSISDLTVEIPLPRPDIRAHHLNVILKPGKLDVSVKDTGEPVLKGDFDEKIQVEDSMWTLSDGKLFLTLEKSRSTWWKCLLLGDPEIDTTKVESTRQLQDYDGETQGALRKILFDQNQKAKGEPTSDQLRTAEVMKHAWNDENSPFKGQPFDPSMLNIQGNLPADFGTKR